MNPYIYKYNIMHNSSLQTATNQCINTATIQLHSRMEIVISSLVAPLRMPHCTVAPLSAAVTFSIVINDGFRPKAVSVDVILSTSLFRVCPKDPEVPVNPGKAERIQRSGDVPVSSQENVKSSPEHVRSSVRCRETVEGRKRFTYTSYCIHSKQV